MFYSCYPARHPQFSLYIHLSPLSALPFFPPNHSSIHTFLLSPLCQQPCSFYHDEKYHYLLCATYTHTLSLARLLSLVFSLFLLSFPSSEGRECKIQRDRIRKGTEGNAERNRTNKSWGRERIDVKDRWGKI